MNHGLAGDAPQVMDKLRWISWKYVSAAVAETDPASVLMIKALFHPEENSERLRST